MISIWLTFSPWFFGIFLQEIIFRKQTLNCYTIATATAQENQTPTNRLLFPVFNSFHMLNDSTCEVWNFEVPHVHHFFCNKTPHMTWHWHHIDTIFVRIAVDDFSAWSSDEARGNVDPCWPRMPSIPLTKLFIYYTFWILCWEQVLRSRFTIHNTHLKKIHPKKQIKPICISKNSPLLRLVEAIYWKMENN